MFAQITFLSLKMIGLTLFLILIAFLITTQEFRPYRNIDLQKTYIQSLYVFLFTIFLAVYGYEEENLNRVISTIIIFINAGFIAIVIIKILHLFGIQYPSRLLNNLLNKIGGNTEEKKKNYFFKEAPYDRREPVSYHDPSIDLSLQEEPNRKESKEAGKDLNLSHTKSGESEELAEPEERRYHRLTLYNTDRRFINEQLCIEHP